MKKRGGFKITNEMLKNLLFKDLNVEIINVDYDATREIIRLILTGKDLPERCNIVEGDEPPALKQVGSFNEDIKLV